MPLVDIKNMENRGDESAPNRRSSNLIQCFSMTKVFEFNVIEQNGSIDSLIVLGLRIYFILS